MASSWDALAITGLLLAAAVAAMAQDEVAAGLYQPRDPCPQVERIVERAVAEEFRKNPQITAGFLRVFFHDCFTGGCDASILLDGEWDRGVNARSVQKRVRDFVNEIRAKVNQECGDSAVSCADILALATRDSVVQAKGPRVPIIRGRFDSFQPGNMSKLPSPFQEIPELLDLFRGFGLKDPADLVALSGGHTVGRTKACGAVRAPFVRTCDRNTPRQVLDVITPDEFDNQYFVGLTRGQGMFPSDQKLLDNANTSAIVGAFANDKQRFFNQFVVSMKKLSDINWVTPRNGEIRRDCTKPNSGRVSIMDADEGFAASA